jgi:hypothetical protein
LNRFLAPAMIPGDRPFRKKIPKRFDFVMRKKPIEETRPEVA